MKRSTDRILSTHVGSLARPVDLLDTMKLRENDQPYDHELFDYQVKSAVADRVRQQVECGIDIVTDGEMSKVSFLGYVKDRLGGFEVEMGQSRMAPSWQVEVDDFPEYYADYFKKYSSTVAPLRRIICRGPITYIGQDLLQTDIDNLKAATADYDVADIFMPSSGPSGFGRNEFYSSHEEYLHEVAEAMREEYLAIVAAGFILQVDDPFLIDMLSDPTMEPKERERLAWIHVEALNHALREHPPRVGAPPHLLRPEPRTPHERHPADRGRAVHAGDQCRRAQLRGRQPAALPRVAHLGGHQAARRQDPHPGSHRARDELRRAPRADRGLHREVRRGSSGGRTSSPAPTAGSRRVRRTRPRCTRRSCGRSSARSAKAPPSPPRPSGANPPRRPAPSPGHLNSHLTRPLRAAGVPGLDVPP